MMSSRPLGSLTAAAGRRLILKKLAFRKWFYRSQKFVDETLSRRTGQAQTTCLVEAGHLSRGGMRFWRFYSFPSRFQTVIKWTRKQTKNRINNSIYKGWRKRETRDADIGFQKIELPASLATQVSQVCGHLQRTDGESLRRGQTKTETVIFYGVEDLWLTFSKRAGELQPQADPTKSGV